MPVTNAANLGRRRPSVAGPMTYTSRMKILLMAALPLTLLAATACLGPAHYAEDESPDGAAIFAGSNCTMCHGSDLRGTKLGPTLVDVEQHWTVDSLMAYLAAPTEVAEMDARLIQIGKDFSNEMPPYDHLLPKHSRVLAQWVIDQASAIE